ncbi:MAG TPA: hypothetical protein VGQ09_00850 [Chitinophagaceae bacterium]|jgi:hypothetical protein|nr:hypothetical protein [Chitinophagaceae bacterium]
MKANTKNNQRGKQRTKHPSETLKERVHRHIADINSKITDEDIRSVRTELEIREQTNPEKAGETNEENKKRVKKSKKQKEENEIDKNEKQTTPWDILSEGYD